MILLSNATVGTLLQALLTGKLQFQEFCAKKIWNSSLCIKLFIYFTDFDMEFHSHQMYLLHHESCFGGLEVGCWPWVPKFAGSNPAEAVGFFRAKKSSARLPSEGK